MHMKTIGYRSLWRLTFSLILLFLVTSFGPSQSLALSPSDLIVVYNLNMQNSKGVAHYYAKKRAVPLSNLVGVRVPTSERMARLDFENELVSTVKTVVERLKSECKKPAILLVYGIPLLVRGSVREESDRAFVALARDKVTEYQGVVLQLISQLDHLVLGNSPQVLAPESPEKNYETIDVLKMAGESFKGGLRYLIEAKSKEGEQESILGASSVLIRLVGAASMAKAILEAAGKGKDDYLKFFKNQELLKWHALLKTELGEISFRGIRPENALETATVVRFVNGVIGELKFWDEIKTTYEDGKYSASVDNELTLILADPYQLARWLPNPFHENYDRLPFINKIRDKTIMVGRLDGPTPELTKRLVDDAIATEKKGLEGIFYIDARGIKGNGSYGSYSWYDRHLFSLYNIIKDESSMDVVIDRGPELFSSGACPNAALYCGWYSLRNYVDSFTWKKGSVGFHVASAEASTLRARDSNVWCKRMVEEGIAATLGPVAEPYLLSFPLPDHFFPLLMSGKFPLLEVYFRSIPSISWRQTLIGDPLYTPFKNNPAIRLPLKKKTKALHETDETAGPGPARF